MHQAAEAQHKKKVSSSGVRLRRTGGPNGARPMGREQLLVALNAGPARICRDELRQSRHAGTSRPEMAEERLSEGRHCGTPRTSSGSPQNPLRTIVSRSQPCGRLGLERRWLDDAECNVQVSRSLQDWNVNCASAKHAVLRHDLSRALHGTSRRQCGRLCAGIADQLRASAER